MEMLAKVFVTTVLVVLGYVLIMTVGLALIAMLIKVFG